MVAEAIVDCYNDDEQPMGLFTMIEADLSLPFETEILGVPVIVERVDISEANEVLAICRRDRECQAIPILNLPLPSPPPEGSEWIEADRHWARAQ